MNSFKDTQSESQIAYFCAKHKICIGAQSVFPLTSTRNEVYYLHTVQKLETLHRQSTPCWSGINLVVCVWFPCDKMWWKTSLLLSSGSWHYPEIKISAVQCGSARAGVCDLGRSFRKRCGAAAEAPRLNRLVPACLQMKLLNLYIKRAQTTNSNSSSSSDVSSHS